MSSPDEPLEPNTLPPAITIEVAEDGLFRRDPATGLLNEHVFYHCAEQFAAKAAVPLVASISEISDFSFFEEAYGPEKVSEILSGMGEYLKSFKGYTIAGYLGNGRIGVLSLWLEGLDSSFIVNSVKDTISKGPIPELKIKFGICENAGVDEDIRTSFRKAEEALAQIRFEYGTTYAVFNKELGETRVRNRALIKCAEQSLKGNDFYVLYQPKFNTATRQVVGAEALVRWDHPTLGAVSPSEFVPLFERTGFICQIDAFVRKTVREDLRRWIEKGHSAVPVSVNVSRRELADAECPLIAERREAAKHLPASLIHLEVTETMWTDSHAQVVTNLKALDAMGVMIELDDFGSGYSNLSMLTKLPIRFVKLDKSLTDEAESTPEIIKHCIAMAHDLGIAVIAEGVETEPQLQQLIALGCDFVQGYHLSKPLPREEFEAFLLS